MPSYQYRKSHCEDKTILRPSYLHNGISYTGKTASLYWIGALNISITFCWPDSGEHQDISMTHCWPDFGEHQDISITHCWPDSGEHQDISITHCWPDSGSDVDRYESCIIWVLGPIKSNIFKHECIAGTHRFFRKTLKGPTIENSSQQHCSGGHQDHPLLTWFRWASGHQHHPPLTWFRCASGHHHHSLLTWFRSSSLSALYCI